MAYKHTKTINSLKRALQQRGIIVYLDTEEFYSEAQKRMIKMYILSERQYDNKKKRYSKHQLLKTADQIGILKYLVDMYKNSDASLKSDF